MTSQTIFAIDIGSAAIKGLVVGINPKKEALEVLAKAEVPAFGVKKGVVFDVDDAARSLGLLVDQIEATLEKELKEVIVSIGGPHLELRDSRAAVVVSRADEEIGKEDVERVLQAVEANALPQNRILLHVIPHHYVIDEADRVKDPVGMQGTRLSAEASVIDAFSLPIKNIQKSLHAIGLSPTLLVASILAGSRAAIPKKERELGVMAIDLGAETTSLAVFEDGELVHTAVIPLGSRNISGDVATTLKVHFDGAEKMKIFAGQALANVVSKKDMIALSEYFENEDEVVSKRYLAEVIEARLSEIFDLAGQELRKVNRSGKLPGGVILYGGGARIPGVVQLAKRELKLPTRLANLEHSRKLFGDDIDLQFYPVCGLVLWALDSMGGRRQSQTGPLDMMKRVLKSFLP